MKILKKVIGAAIILLIIMAAILVTGAGITEALATLGILAIISVLAWISICLLTSD